MLGGVSITAVPPAPPAHAATHFRARLAFETDPADVAAAMGDGTFVLVDARSAEAYAAGHLPGAISLPHATMSEATTADLPRDRLLVTYCWGPGCNGATKGALRLAELGFAVKELIGGYEYWVREGHS